MTTLRQVIYGTGVQVTETFGHTFKDLHDKIRCADGTVLSVQASHTHYCTPRLDYGPYSHVEVGYPTADPPETWRTYADGEYPSTVYGYVPVELVREFIDSHGGEQE